MGGACKVASQQGGRFAGLLQEGEHLVQDIGHDVSILVFPLHTVLQSDLLRLPPEVLAEGRRSGSGLDLWGSGCLF